MQRSARVDEILRARTPEHSANTLPPLRSRVDEILSQPFPSQRKGLLEPLKTPPAPKPAPKHRKGGVSLSDIKLDFGPGNNNSGRGHRKPPKTKPKPTFLQKVKAKLGEKADDVRALATGENFSEELLAKQAVSHAQSDGLSRYAHDLYGDHYMNKPQRKQQVQASNTIQGLEQSITQVDQKAKDATSKKKLWQDVGDVLSIPSDVVGKIGDAYPPAKFVTTPVSTALGLFSKPFKLLEARSQGEVAKRQSRVSSYMLGGDQKTAQLLANHNKTQAKETKRGIMPGGSYYNTVKGESDDTAEELGRHVLRQNPEERKSQEESAAQDNTDEALPLLKALNTALMPSTQADEDSDYDIPWEERKENSLNRDPDDFHSI